MTFRIRITDPDRNILVKRAGFESLSLKEDLQGYAFKLKGEFIY